MLPPNPGPEVLVSCSFPSLLLLLLLLQAGKHASSGCTAKHLRGSLPRLGCSKHDVRATTVLELQTTACCNACRAAVCHLQMRLQHPGRLRPLEAVPRAHGWCQASCSQKLVQVWTALKPLTHVRGRHDWRASSVPGERDCTTHYSDAASAWGPRTSLP